MCTSVCFKSAIISVLIAQSHSDDNHVNVTAPCMSCTRMHFAQARPPMSCIPLVYVHVVYHSVNVEQINAPA